MQLRTIALAASMFIALAGLNACSSTASNDAMPLPALGTSATHDTAPIITQTAAAQAAGFEFTGDHYPLEVASQSTLTRAQVKAQVQDAMARGQLQPVGDAYLPLSQQQQSSNLSREQVRQETIAAGKAGLLDSYGE